MLLLHLALLEIIWNVQLHMNHTKKLWCFDFIIHDCSKTIYET